MTRASFASSASTVTFHVDVDGSEAKRETLGEPTKLVVPLTFLIVFLIWNPAESPVELRATTMASKNHVAFLRTSIRPVPSCACPESPSRRSSVGAELVVGLL